MSEEKPLHVQVAEALGWTYVEPEMTRPEWGWQEPDWWLLLRDNDPRFPEPMRGSPPDFDTDWSATGPLIEKYGLRLWPHPVDRWIAKWQGEAIGDGEYAGQYEMQAADGDTPLVAVCHLILALKAAGKL